MKKANKVALPQKTGTVVPAGDGKYTIVGVDGMYTEDQLRMMGIIGSTRGAAAHWERNANYGVRRGSVATAN